MVEAPKAPTKRMKKEIKTLRKGLKQEKQRAVNVDRKVTAKTANLSSEMDKLRQDMEKLSKKKASKKQLSEYNLFMRRQLNDGKTFAQSVRLWKAYKSGKPLVKTKVIKRTVIRNVLSKPRIKYRTRTVTKTVQAKPRIITRTVQSKPKIVTRTIVRNVKSKPKVITRTIVKRVPVTKTRTIVRTVRVPAQAAPVARESSNIKVFESLFSRMKESEVDKMHLSDEELAVRLVSLYFEEIARMGFKRQLELDDVINAYYHALGKLKGRKIEASAQPSVIVQTQPVVVESKQ